MRAAAVVTLLAMFSFLFPSKAKEPGTWVPDPGRKLVVYIGWPLERPVEWKKTGSYSSERLELEDGTLVEPSTVSSRLLVYPNNEAMGGARVFLPLPAGVTFLEPKAGPKEPLALDSVQMELGKVVCQVRHSRFRKNEDGRPIYATTLRNISSQPIRIQKFAGFGRVREKYVLSTVTGVYFTAEQFISWYAVPEDGWIAPGAEVTDDSNYGRGNGIWAYFGVTRDGNYFIAAESLPK